MNKNSKQNEVNTQLNKDVTIKNKKEITKKVTKQKKNAEGSSISDTKKQKKVEPEIQPKAQSSDTEASSDTKQVSTNINVGDAPVIARLKMRGKPYEMQVLAKSIDKNKPIRMVDALMIRNTKYSIAMAKLIKSCLANVKYKGLNPEKMLISKLSVGRGTFLKRRGFKGRGRTELICKPHAKVFLEMRQREAS